MDETTVIDTTGETVQEVRAKDGEIVVAEESAAIQAPMNDAALSEVLNSMGFVMPAADPDMIRQAFAYKQRMFAAILDENDYLYTVSYQNQRGSKTFTDQLITTDHAYAQDRAQAFNGKVSARPKKSGIVKLARALGIVARPIENEGLPKDPNATFSYVKYEAVHERTGVKEIGIGFCDSSERNGKISKHHIITTADTRGYNRAVMRLSGFGEASADEIIAGASEGQELPDRVPVTTTSMRKPEPLPPSTDENVVAAARSWAEAIAGRDMNYAPDAQQATKNARNLRARARRGDVKAGTQLGATGMHWAGVAQDDNGVESFQVNPSPIDPKDVVAAHAAAVRQAKEDAALGALGSKGNGAIGAPPKESNPTGWNLSGKGSEKDDAPKAEKPIETVSAEENIPAPDPNAPSISGGQARKLSKMLMERVGNDRDAAKKWLAEVCHVGKSTELRANQYELVKAALTPKKKES
jgi:hypothetical protein